MASAREKLGVAVTLQRALTVTKRRFAPMLGVVVLGYVLSLPVAFIIGFTAGPASGATGSNPVLGLVSSVFSFLVNAAVQSALQHLALNGLAGRNVGIGAALGLGVRQMGPVAGLTVLLFLALLFSGAFFVAPALFLLSMWFVALPAKIAEGISVFSAFSRSQALTYGNRWRILGIFGLMLAGFVLLLIVFSIQLGLLGPVGALILALIVYSVLPMAVATVGAATYRELRRIAGEDDQIASVFE